MATWTEGRICSFDPVVFHSFKFAPLWVLWLFSSKHRWPHLETRPSMGRFTVRCSRNLIHHASIDCGVMTLHLFTRIMEFVLQGNCLVHAMSQRRKKKNSQKINYCWKFFWFSTPWSSSHSFTQDQASQHLQVGLPWNFLLTFKVPQMIHSAFGVYRRIKFHVDETYL